MEAIIDALSSVKCTEDIEAAISLSTALNITTYFRDDAAGVLLKDNFNSILEKVLNNSEITTTAKLRRRIKRFQQSLDNVNTPAAMDIVEESSISNFAPTTCVPHLNADESITALLACRSYHDLAREMNNLYAPREEEGGIMGASFAEHRTPMKNALKSLVAQKGMTNKILRRRVNRLIFVLSTVAEQAQEVAAVKAKAQMVATRNLTAKKIHVPVIAEVVTVPAIIPVLSKFEAARFITDCISGIRSAKTPSDVERVIGTLPAKGLGDSEILRDLLTSLLDNSDLVNNAKVRRRVKRLIETLAIAGTAASDVPILNAVTEIPREPPTSSLPSTSSSIRREEIKVVQRAPAPQPLRIPSVVAPAIVSPPSHIRVITGSFASSLIQLQNAITSSDVEDAISELSIESEGDEVTRESVREKLEEVFKNAQLISNSKLRRRVKRLIDVLAPPSTPDLSAVAALSSEEMANLLDPKPVVIKVKIEKVKKEKVKKADLGNPPAGAPLDDILQQAYSSKSCAELSDVVLTVTAESGNCNTRRTLKRMLERVLKDDSSLSKDMTAQMRRKFRRVADMMSARPPEVKSCDSETIADAVNVEK